jgi:hypothetical protein
VSKGGNDSWGIDAEGRDMFTSCNCVGVYPRPPIVPIPPALDTAAASGPPDVRAMPASMMGYLMPRSLVSGVLRDGVEDMIAYARSRQVYERQ